MKNTTAIDEKSLDVAITLFERGFENKYIETRLIESGMDKETIIQVLERINSLRYEKNSQRRQKGTVFMIIGVLLFSLSFILTAMMYEANQSSFGMITTFLATLGAVTIMIGISNIFAL